MFDKEIFAERVKESLKERGQTQRALASAIHCEPGTLSKYLKPTDKLLPKIDTLYEMSAFLGVSADWLMGKSDRKRAGDIVSARDICNTIMQLRNLRFINFQSTTIQKHEFCNYGEYEGSEERDNAYTAYFFSNYFDYVDDDPCWYDGNYCPTAISINGFIAGYEHSTSGYEQGLYTRETYDTIIKNLLHNVSDKPLPVMTENNSTGVV